MPLLIFIMEVYYGQ